MSTTVNFTISDKKALFIVNYNVKSKAKRLSKNTINHIFAELDEFMTDNLFTLYGQKYLCVSGLYRKLKAIK